MKKMTIGWRALFVALISAGSLLAHHSLGNYDTTKAVRVKGTVFQFHLINPHSFIYLDQKDAEGRILARWAVEDPTIQALNRRGFGKDVLKPGDVVEVCGYAPKEPLMWQIANADGSASPAGRLLNAELLVMPDGRQESWGDYGVHKCFAPGYTDQHSSK